MSSANAFNLDQSKTLSSGNGLKQNFWRMRLRTVVRIEYTYPKFMIYSGVSLLIENTHITCLEVKGIINHIMRKTYSSASGEILLAF